MECAWAFNENSRESFRGAFQRVAFRPHVARARIILRDVRRRCRAAASNSGSISRLSTVSLPPFLAGSAIFIYEDLSDDVKLLAMRSADINRTWRALRAREPVCRLADQDYSLC